MDVFSERLARVGLAAAAPFGFALAGGYALQAHGFGDRPSEDVDLFTTEGGGPGKAARIVAAAYRDDGLMVIIEWADETFARLVVLDGALDMTKVELCVDFRKHPPVDLPIGPVLHIEDAIASKMSALLGRYFARDFIDIYLVLRDGRFKREDLASLVGARDPGFDSWFLAGALAELPHIPDEELAVYGLDETAIAMMRAYYADWYRALLESGPPYWATSAS